MSTQETTTKTETATSKRAKASKKPAKAKKVAKASKAKSRRSGSKAEKVLELIKRKEGANPRGDCEGQRLAESQHSRVCQRARYKEAWTES